MSDGGPRRTAGRAPALAVALATMVLAACATKTVDPGEPKVVHEHAMSPYVIHEECRRLAAGDRLEFDFTSTEPVAFNIHYHESNAVLIPILREKTVAESGLFAPRFAQEYCLMWEAGPGGAVLDYRIQLRLAGRP